MTSSRRSEPLSYRDLEMRYQIKANGAIEHYVIPYIECANCQRVVRNVLSPCAYCGKPRQ